MASAGPFSTLKFSFLYFLYYAFSFDNFRDIIHIPNCPAGNCAVETAALLSVIPLLPLVCEADPFLLRTCNKASAVQRRQLLILI